MQTRTAIVIAFAIVASSLPAAALAASVRSSAIACRDQGTLRSIAMMRNKKDKASPAFEAQKKSSGDCIELPRGASVGIDLRNPPLVCVRAAGDLDCYWTAAALIDEFPGQQGAQPAQGK